MNLTIDIAADLESRLLQEAAKHGIDPGQYVVNAVRASLQANHSVATCLSADQSRLLEEINRGLSETDWNRYYSLVAQRQRGTLSENDYSELAALSNRIEELNAHRLEYLAELARLRGTTLSGLMDELGIVAPPVI